MEIETCNDPDTLCELLTDLYSEEFNYVKMVYKTTISSEANEYSGYEAPYENFLCSTTALFNSKSEKCNNPISSDTYMFFRGYSEEPLFMMDCNATYIVGSYEIHNFDDGTNAHQILGWVISDMFMCLHEYIDADTETKEFNRDAVRYMDFYIEFENLIIEALGEDDGSITKTESHNPSIDILSVEIVGPTFHELEVKYRINNISDKRGRVYLTCSGHAYQDELRFNDDNFENDYREDGTYTYKINYCGNEKPVTFTIFYGYGDFDTNEGWQKTLSTTVSLLYLKDVFFTETNNTIGSVSIPKEEIYPLYFEGTYVGAWTTHESCDLIEID